MPPKTSAKADQKAKAKIVEDKTFGLKNKNKSAKMAKYVAQVQQQVNQMGNRKDQQTAEQKKKDADAKRAAEEAKKKELAELFKPVQQQQKVPFGVDPKTIVCAFFKSGSCEKGSKCKFSHDLNLERKSAKADIYTDARQKDEDSMENWDQTKLEEAVATKHGKDATNLNKATEIVCKYFLDAIENNKYGWFWECPNGGDKCKYRHALPPGFVLKKKETPEERREREERERENQITIEEFLETERHKVEAKTPINLETFTAWKQRRKEQAAADEAKKKKEKEAAYRNQKAGGKATMSFSGRELFEFNPEMAVGQDAEDEGAMGAEEYADRSASEHGDSDKEAGGISGDDSDGEEEEDNGGPVDGLAKKVGEMEVNEELFAEEDVDLGDDDDGDDEEE
ncbi:hypothetical protein DFJ74DRAFT_687765 [Hyaloraphidium curvatum]|nr:hypothetical protein DFJ74DRAFT_687765 [Hyaloraphidium curvatum]